MQRQDPVADPISESIGAAVRRARTAGGESMRTLAARAGISQPMLSKVENGQILPSLTTVYGLAAALGVPAASLLPAAGSGGAAPLHFAVDDAAPAPGAQLLVGGAGAPFHVFLVTGRAGDDDRRDFVHDGEEFVYVVAGDVVLHRGGEEERLGAGDSITYDASVAHRWSVSTDATYLLVSST
jgi:transcriptional regulator with XRE-family HTH domain